MLQQLCYTLKKTRQHSKSCIMETKALSTEKLTIFKSKTNIGDINSSGSDDEEEGAEYKVKRISNNEWCECSAKAFVGRCSSK